jgi:O-acetyl-ADP-ribose deacetylase (regulator of RNase III)
MVSPNANDARFRFPADGTSAEVDGTRLRLLIGDITRITVDAIVNAANESLLGGGGVDGAIHRAGGPAILEECRLLGGCRPGEAKLTTAGRLPARYVIHTVGPRYYVDPAGAPRVLASAYRSSLALVEQHSCASVAFPSISTGAFGYPVERAARVALDATVTYIRSAGRTNRILRDVVFVLYDQHTYDVYTAELATGAWAVNRYGLAPDQTAGS